MFPKSATPFILSLLLFVVLLETVGRLFLPNRLQHRLIRDERNTFYRYDSHLGWVPNQKAEGVFDDNVPFTVKTNSSGFRDREHRMEKSSKRILVVGDSFVWGYGVENSDIFTSQLEAMDPSVEVINLGVSGYGSDQEYLLLEREIDSYAPDVVLLIFNPGNDHQDNSSNERYHGYFKPYFTLDPQGEIILQGSPVPKSLRYNLAHLPSFAIEYSVTVRTLAILLVKLDFLKEKHVPDPTLAILSKMRALILARGSQFAIGLVAKDPSVTSFCKESFSSCIDLETSLRFSYSGNHWTPEGHRWVSRVIHQHYRELFPN